MASIGVDVDGVIYDFVQALIDYAECTYGYRDLDYAKSWDFYNLQWGWSDEEFFKIYAEGVHDGILWVYGQPLEESKEYINKLYDEGHEIHIVTNRAIPGVDDITAYILTEGWLDKCDIKYTSISITKDKTCVPVDYFIEDNVENYLALKECGVNAVLINREWNQHYKTKDRVNNWKEFYQLVNTLETLNAQFTKEATTT